RCGPVAFDTHHRRHAQSDIRRTVYRMGSGHGGDGVPALRWPRQSGRPGIVYPQSHTCAQPACRHLHHGGDCWPGQPVGPFCSPMSIELEHFEDHLHVLIAERGRAYVDAGHVLMLEETAEGWTAVIEGSESYQVLLVGHDVIHEWH